VDELVAIVFVGSGSVGSDGLEGRQVGVQPAFDSREVQ
jgi:hypothetical protein